MEVHYFLGVDFISSKSYSLRLYFISSEFSAYGTLGSVYGAVVAYSLFKFRVLACQCRRGSPSYLNELSSMDTIIASSIINYASSLLIHNRFISKLASLYLTLAAFAVLKLSLKHCLRMRRMVVLLGITVDWSCKSRVYILRTVALSIPISAMVYLTFSNSELLSSIAAVFLPVALACRGIIPYLSWDFIR